MKIYYDSNGDGTEDSLVANVISFPTIINGIDKIGICSFTIRDKLGALYATWKDYDFRKVKIEDDNSNVLFRGYIVDKRFTHNTLQVSLKGIGIKLEWSPFNHNYILAEGKVSAPIPYNGGDLPLEEVLIPNAEGGTLEWTKTAATHWQSVVDYSDEELIVAGDGHENDEDIIEFSTTVHTVVSCTQVIVSLYGMNVNDAGVDPTVDLDAGDGYIGAQLCNFTTSNSWVHVTFAGLANIDQTDIDALKVKVIANADYGATEATYIRGIYVTLTYEGNSVYALGVKQDDPDNEDPVFAWDLDQWVEGKNTGLLIVDNTGAMSEQQWACTAVTDTGTADTEVGDETEVADFTGYNWWVLEDSNDPIAINGDLIFSGAVIDHTKVLNNIRIHINANLDQYASSGSATSGTLQLQVYYDGGWINLGESLTRSYAINTLYHHDWYGKGKDGEGNLIDDIIITDTNAELLKYFGTDGGDDYNEFKLRFVVSGSAPHAFSTVGVNVNYARISVDYSTYSISPIMEQIDKSFATAIWADGITWDETGVAEDDYFKIGENTNQILSDIAWDCGLTIYCLSTLTKYIARWFKGGFCNEALEAIDEIEGLHWWEDYTNEQIIIGTEGDFIASGATLTQADYIWSWTIHDTPNQYKKVVVYGNAALRIVGSAIDTSSSNTSPLIKNIINDAILTVPDAEAIAIKKLAELDTKRLQIEIPLQGINATLTVGDTVDLTMVDPTLSGVYPISKIKREKKAYVGTDDIWTTIYCGLGSTSLDEKITGHINRAFYTARRAHLNRLVSTPFSVGGASIQWGDVAGANVGAVAAVNAAGLILASGKIIDSADEDLTFRFGRALIDSRFADMMIISHRDMSTQDQYAFGQLNDGKTYINAPTGKLIYFHINDVEKMSMSAVSLNMSVPISMGANNITLGAGQTVDGVDVSTLSSPDKTREKAMQMMANNGGAFGDWGVDVNADGEGAIAYCNIPSNVDESQSIWVHYQFQCGANNAATSLKKWISAQKTDGSEPGQWQIDNGTVFTDGATTSGRYYDHAEEIETGEFEANDNLFAIIRSNEAGLDRWFNNFYLVYEVV